MLGALFNEPKEACQVDLGVRLQKEKSFSRLDLLEEMKNLKQVVRLALQPLNLDIVSKSRLSQSELLSQLLESSDILQRYPYGYFQRGASANGTLWMTHEAGFFSCLTTFMWTIIDLSRSGDLCHVVNNSLSMNYFKEVYGRWTWYELFEKREKAEIDHILSLPPIKQDYFDHHSDFHEIVGKHLGHSWTKAFLDAYMTPCSDLVEMANIFDEKYRISSAPTIAVCYRGTDKWAEVAPTPISDYFNAVNKQLTIYPGAEVLIQTDQAQVRDQFMMEYGSHCKFIEELPVTRGKRVLHSDRHLCGDRDLFAMRLYAMCLAISRSQTLVTHTGNVGFFLAMHTLINGKEVIQFS